MATKSITLDGQSWDLAELADSFKQTSLTAVLARADIIERMGPSALLGYAAVSTTSSTLEARALLRSQFGFNASRSKDAATLGAIISGSSVHNDPYGFLAGLTLSPAQRLRSCAGLIEQNPQPPIGDKLTVAVAKSAWATGHLRRFALDAGRTRDPVVMGVAASVIASLRHHDPAGFVAGITASQTHSLAAGRSITLERHANSVLSTAYTLSALDPRGLELGRRRWNAAPPNWRLSAAPWVYPILDAKNGTDVAALLDAVRARGLKLAKPGVSPFPFRDSRAELDDTVLRVRSVADQLTKWFDRPMWFDGGPGGVQVLIIQDDLQYLYAWVGMNEVGALVAVDLLNFLPYGMDVPGTLAAATLALGWYLDVSISLKGASAGTGTLRRTSTGSAAKGSRYVPSPTFTQQVRGGVSGLGTPPRLHGVAPYIRTFNNGYVPSERARSRAPQRLRSTLKANQTFVRGHLRGKGHRAAVEARLSKYSALGDAIAALRRNSG